MSNCPHCGGPMTKGGTALVCGPDGGGGLRLPDYCDSAQCRKDRDEKAIKDAIARGVIRP